MTNDQGGCLTAQHGPLRGGTTMKIKKFVGSSMSECLLKVKRELGDNAVILDSRKVPRGGPFSFLLTDMIEVIASTEDRSQRTLGSGSRGDFLRSQTRPVREGRDEPDPYARAQNAAPSRPEQGQPRSEAFAHAPAGAVPVSSLEMALIADDLKGLRETVQQITDHLKFKQLPSLPAELEKLHRNLLDNGVDDRAAGSLTQEMALTLAGGDFEDRALLERALHERVGKIVRTLSTENRAPKTDPSVRWDRKPKTEDQEVGHRLSAIGHRPRVIALVGPTGVGKTTTLAKMATHPSLYGKQRVALVSADTYRIAAVEQLKTFASIANLPMEAVYRPADMRRVIDRFTDPGGPFGGRDVVLIDTAGRSQNDRGQLNDLGAFLDFASPDEVHLVLSISTRLDDQLDVLSKFSAVRPKAMIFTKLDETTSFGMILNVCFNLSPQGGQGQARPLSGILPISLLTCGQNVPDDVMRPSQSQLVRLMCGREYFREMINKINT